MKIYLDQVYADERKENGTRLLMAAIVDRAIRDAAGREPICDAVEAAKAVWFLHSDFCQEICLETNTNYNKVAGMAEKLYTRRIEKEILAGIYQGLPKAGRRVSI